MNADIPVAQVLAAIVPAPREPADEPCPCATCFEERARQRGIDDWRNSRQVDR